MDTGALDPNARVQFLGDLALFLRGSEDSFTGVLLSLIAKADPGNRACLRRGFPEAVATWEAWQSCTETPTAAELRNIITIRTRDWAHWGGHPL